MKKYNETFFNGIVMGVNIFPFEMSVYHRYF
jgi:hypothetical protein